LRRLTVSGSKPDKNASSSENQMRKNNITITALAFVIPILFLWPACARAQAAKAPYQFMATLDQYLIPDEKAEVALARSSAPASISDAAEVMVLRRDGYATAVNGSNGFVCIVERSWAKPTDDPEFWNPKVRAPNCFNPAASRTFLPIFLKKTKLVLAGKSKAQILAATTSALEQGELPALAPGAMCYMMAKQQYLSDDDMSWHPHVMFFVSGDAVKSWGANLPGSPVIAGDDPEERVTVFMVLAGTWSDGTPGPSTMH
jgi:hypothetical protein